MNATTTDGPPPMLDRERADAYTRRTGHYPPTWTLRQCIRQDARIRQWEEVAGRGTTERSRARARRQLRRWGSDA